MDDDHKLLVKEDSFFLRTFLALAKERLTNKQKIILTFVSVNPGLTATATVRLLSKDLDCSRAALFNNIRSLKRAGLIKYEHNQPLSLTPAAKQIVGGLHG